MLRTPTTPTESEGVGKRRLGRERRLWHYEERATTPLGCPSCPDRNECGGLRSKAAIFDCLDLCCGKPAQCDNVCRNNPTYAFRVREVGGFSLNTIAATDPVQIAPPVLPSIVPLIYHGSGRREKIAVPAVAASLYEMFRRTDGAPRYTSREALCAALGIAIDATIILSGTHNDRPLEGWWALGAAGRRAIMKNLRGICVSLVTSPNYSLFTDTPRWNDLHSIKRIGITHQEFLSEGLAAALHVNGRTETDFKRWAAYLRAHPEITHLAYEFTTGTRWAGRKEQHVAWLSSLARSVGRPLHLSIRGGMDLLPQLSGAFASLTLIETSSFVKTMKRQRASINAASRIVWSLDATEAGAPLDALLRHNMSVLHRWVTSKAAIAA
jgi:hypothetical protein